MAVRLVLEGVTQFLDDLRAVPDDVADRAAHLVYAAADATLRELQGGAYPPRDPRSRSRFLPIAQAMHVYTRNKGPLAPRAIVTHDEILAVWYEQGTKERFSRAKGGPVPRRGRRANYTIPRGRMPAAPTFVPITVRHQRQLANDLVDVLTSAGFTVTDDGR